MPKSSRRAFSETEKALLVGEIRRVYANGGLSMRVVAERHGISEATYYGWVKAGVKPPPTSRTRAPRRSAEERRQLVDAVTARVANGASITAACLAAGVNEKSFRSWRAELVPPPMREVEVTALVPVQAASITAVTFAPPEPAPRSLTLHAPGGYRVEGLDTESVAAILRNLSC